MKTRLQGIALVLLAALLSPTSVALTMNDIVTFCESYQGECDSSPFLQAYVGGAMDLVAMLDEETDYLDKIYCSDPKDFFDTGRIIRYMRSNASDEGDENAMLLFVRFLEEHGNRCS
ncbi:MAG: hypothetical protein AAGG55_06975 [Pseudomonadota bacterium]